MFPNLKVECIQVTRHIVQLVHMIISAISKLLTDHTHATVTEYNTY